MNNERWAKYNKIMNISSIKGFRVEKWKPPGNDVGMMYTGDMKPTEKKPWVLFADHEPIAVFDSKAAATEVATDLIKGKYDIK